jgi:hypothetical protein
MGEDGARGLKTSMKYQSRIDKNGNPAASAGHAKIGCCIYKLFCSKIHEPLRNPISSSV